MKFKYYMFDYRGMSASMIIPPDEIVYLGNKKTYVPDALRLPKNGDMVWNIKCSNETEDNINILTIARTSGYEPQWIYKLKEETCS